MNPSCKLNIGKSLPLCLLVKIKKIIVKIIYFFSKLLKQKFIAFTKFEQAISHVKNHTAEQSQMLILSINQEAIKKHFYHIIDC